MLSIIITSELVYDDVFSVWETIWAARHMTSSHFVLFIALALVQVYREIILVNNMDFTDIIKFFNGESSELFKYLVSCFKMDTSFFFSPPLCYIQNKIESLTFMMSLTVIKSIHLFTVSCLLLSAHILCVLKFGLVKGQCQGTFVFLLRPKHVKEI